MPGPVIHPDSGREIALKGHTFQSHYGTYTVRSSGIKALPNKLGIHTTD